MKQLLLFSAFIFCYFTPLSSFSQTFYKVDEKRIYTWDDFAMPAGWEQEVTETYTYGNGGIKETNILGKSFPDGDDLYQYIKTYNGNNDIVVSTSQIKNGASWLSISKTDYTYYSGTSKVKDETTFDYNLGYNTSKNSYEYSGNDIFKITIEKGNAGGLYNETQFVYAYNGSTGLPETETENEWVAGAWKPKELSIATYTTGKRTVNVYKYVNGAWATQPFERYITSYSGELETEYLWQTWEDPNWKDNDREMSYYDANGNKTIYIIDDTFVGPMIGYYKEEKAYSVAAPLSAQSFEIDNFKVFPNPASDVIHIATSVPIDKIEMFDLTGKTVYKSTFTNQINAKNFKAGIYFLKASSENKSLTKKVIIK